MIQERKNKSGLLPRAAIRTRKLVGVAQRKNYIYTIIISQKSLLSSSYLYVVYFFLKNIYRRSVTN